MSRREWNGRFNKQATETVDNDWYFLSSSGNHSLKVASIIGAMDSNDTTVSKPPLHFKNPPIVEAVIFISVSPLPESILEQFDSLAAKMAELGYKSPTSMSQNQFKLEIREGKSKAETSDVRHGLRFDSTDGLHAVQFNRSEFLFSRLGRYETWESFRDTAKKLWELYLGEIGPAELISFGVRYINKVFIPLDTDINLYLNIYPFLPQDIPQSVTEQFMRLAFPISDPQGVLVHQQILLPPEKEDFATVLLDNDFRFSAIGLSSAGIWDHFEKVRTIKDDYFVKFVTEKLMETFNV